MLNLFDTIFNTDGFAVRLNYRFRLIFFNILKNLVIFYKVTKRTLRTAYVQESTGIVTSCCIVTGTQFCL